MTVRLMARARWEIEYIIPNTALKTMLTNWLTLKRRGPDEGMVGEKIPYTYYTALTTYWPTVRNSEE